MQKKSIDGLCVHSVPSLQAVSPDQPAFRAVAGSFRLPNQTVKIMRLLSVFLFVASLAVSARPAAQTVTLSGKNLSLKQVFSAIKKQTGYVVFSEKDQLTGARPVSLSVNDIPLADVLDKALILNGLTYTIRGKTIFVSRAPVKPKPKNLKDEVIEEETALISGRVTNAKKEPLEGVSITVKDTQAGTTTNADGQFQLSVSSINNVELVFSFVGYATQTVKARGETVFNIVMQEAVSDLSNIVVVGYGTQKRNVVTGSISTIKGSELTKAPVPNISNSIAGKLTGVSMSPNGGQPGQDNPSIYIRGIGTIGNNAPLVIVDGILRDNINQIDPSIIETVSVLKDAAAVAPYGLGGANGVILITTKKGNKQSPSISINSYYGIQSPTYLPKLLTAKDYMLLTNEAYLNEQPGTTNLPYTYDLIENYDNLNTNDPDVYANSSTLDLIKKNTPIQNYSLQLSGGSDNTKYFANLSYFGQEGLFKKVNYNRYNYSINLESKVTNSTKVTFSFLGSQELTNNLEPGQSTTRLFRSIYKFIPTQPIYYSNGLPGMSAGNSIAAILDSDGYEKNNGNTILSSVMLEQQIPFVKGLSIKGNFSYDSRSNFIKGWHTPWYYWIQDITTTPYTYTKSSAGLEGGTPYTFLEQIQQYKKYFTYQGYANYQRTFGSHQITGLIVAEARKFKSDSFYVRRNNFAVNIDELDMGSSSRVDYNNGGTSSIGTQIGYIYRLNYEYKEKYLLEATGRYDGHYYFAPGKKWGFFPAFSMGWRISEEKFMKNVDFINNLKIRGSWGKSGNLAGAAYQYLSGYNLAGSVYAFGTNTIVQGAYNTQEANPNITWEVSKMTDIGFEATLWKRLLIIEADYFFERRSGMLLSPAVTVPYEYGVTLAQENAGEMKRYGFELRIGTRYDLSNGLQIGFDGNFSIAKNKMIQVFETYATYNNPNRRVTGRPFGTPFGYQSLGLFKNSDDKNGDGIINSDDGYNIVQFGTLHPGDIKYADIGGPDGVPDGKIDDNDRVVIGHYPGNPAMTFGFTSSLSWKGFDLSLFFQGSALKSTDISTFQTVAFQNNKSNSSYEYFNNHWTPENENARYPRATTSPYANNTQSSDFWMINTSYLRFKTINFGYTLQSSFLKLQKIKSIRFYVTGQNLITFSKLKFQDPETPGGGTEAVYYPNMKSVLLGANFIF